MALTNLLANNLAWSERIRSADPEFFQKLSRQQSPEYLWIGCADSRVPANEIVGLLPGEIFVHRNVANIVVHTDLNCLSVIQFAVEILKVKHIIVVGHYGCGGIRFALNKTRLGLSDNWLRHVHDVEEKHHAFLAKRDDLDWQHDRLCELNVIEQVRNVCQTTIVQEAWEKKADLSVHGWVYSLKNGLVNDLSLCATGIDSASSVYDQACSRVHRQA